MGQNQIRERQSESNHQLPWCASAPDGYFEDNILRHLEESGSSNDLLWTARTEGWQVYQRKSTNYASHRNQ